MKIIIVENEKELAKVTSCLLLQQIKKKPNSVIGFSTGGSPLETYGLLVEDYQTNHTDWSQVITFNLDEYVGLDPTNRQSYSYYMYHNLFDHINVKRENIHIPSGLGDLQKNCESYEHQIAQLGPIDWQLLGLGRNGHIGYNEPGSDLNSTTRIIELKKSTLEANSRWFKKGEEIPKSAISMGVKTILQARTVVLIAYGKNKQRPIKEVACGPVSSRWPCTYLRNHPNSIVIADRAAAKLLLKK